MTQEIIIFWVFKKASKSINNREQHLNIMKFCFCVIIFIDTLYAVLAGPFENQMQAIVAQEATQ
jgi:hypothetical protein